MADASDRPGPHRPDRDGDDLPFETLLERLGAVVDRLERGDLPLEESIATFEEGVRLSRLGQARLDAAERRVEALFEDERGVGTKPLEDEDGA